MELVQGWSGPPYPGLLPQPCWASKEENVDTRDKVKDKEGSGSEIRTETVRTTQVSQTGVLGCSVLHSP